MCQIRHVLSIFFGAAFTIATIRATGLLLFRRLGIKLHALEHELLASATGACILSFIVFLLCAANLARVWIFLVTGAILLTWNRWLATRLERPQLPPISTAWKLIFAAPFVLYALLYLSNSLAPEASPDGQAYHLGLVYRYYREHGFHRLTTNMYANLSQGMEMLFLYAFAFGRQSAAATVHCCYLLLLPFLIVSYGRRIERPQAGVCAAMLAFLSPVMGIDGISAYNDVALAATAFALFYILEIWRDAQNDRLLIPAGLLAGFCYAIKYTGFVAFLYAAAVILWQKRPRALIPLAGAAAIIILPWPIKDWIWLHNPVSPFLNRIFPNPYIHVSFEDFYTTWFRTYALPSLRPWPWIITTRGQLGGQIGPLFLLAPLGLFALRSRAGRHCLLAASFFLVPYSQNIGARFLIPVIPFIAIGIALVCDFSRTALATLVCAAAVLAWPKVIDRYDAHPAGWYINHMPWQAALRIVPQDDFLRSRSTAWVTAQMLDYLVPYGKRVWSTTPVAESYTKADIMISYQSAEGDLIEDILTNATRDDLAPRWNLRFTFPARELQRLRIMQTATNASDIWSIGEIRIFNEENELPPDSSWRFRAQPFPWDIALAFDRNPATRWRSWQSIRLGMHVDVDFGKLVELDRIELHCSHDQGSIQVHPESCEGSSCSPIPARLEKLEDPSPGDIRKDAIRAVKAHHIDYILIDDGNWTAADMCSNPGRWGMKFVAVRAGNRLYRIL